MSQIFMKKTVPSCAFGRPLQGRGRFFPLSQPEPEPQRQIWRNRAKLPGADLYLGRVYKRNETGGWGDAAYLKIRTLHALQQHGALFGVVPKQQG
jgi:hypothetical protein